MTPAMLLVWEGVVDPWPRPLPHLELSFAELTGPPSVLYSEKTFVYIPQSSAQ